MAIPALAFAAPETASDEWALKAHDKFSDGRRSFDKVQALLREAYYKQGLDDDDLWRAAAQGMLEHVDPRMARWNKLLSPSEMEALRSDLSGQLVGIGVELKFDDKSGISDVLGVIPGSPSERAGLQAGDKILDVDGRFYQGKTIADVVADLRGAEGSTVTLTLLRRDRTISQQVRRERITLEDVRELVLPGGVGYLAVSRFTERTAASATAAVGRLAAAHVRALVVDVRDNQGGLFDGAVSFAELLVGRGHTIVELARRGGGIEKFAAQRDAAIAVPIVVLTNGATASGAEFVAAALHEDLGAPVVGNKTFGKWSVQRIEDLPNHFSLKLTTAMFLSPSGKSFEGEGFVPDLDVVMDPSAFAKLRGLTDVNRRVAEDPQLRAALSLLAQRR